MPAITVTVHAAEQQWAVSVDADDAAAAIKQVSAEIQRGQDVRAQGAYGTPAAFVRWNPAHVTHISAPAA